MRERPVQAAAIAFQHAAVETIDPAIEPGWLRRNVAQGQVTTTQCRGQGQRNDRRHRDGRGNRHGERMQHHAEESRHEKQRQEYRYQRCGDRDDGEADLVRAVERGLQA